MPGFLKRNMRVEVRLHGAGLEGAVWYEGKLQYITKKLCKVLIYNLYNERNTSFAMEETQQENVRPVPPPVHGFSSDLYEEGDAVEVFDRGGWWVGVITKRLRKDKFTVYFREFGYAQDYDVELMRVRQDFNMERNEWVMLDSKFKKYAKE